MSTGKHLAEMWVTTVKMRCDGNARGWFRCPTTGTWHGLDLPGYLIKDMEGQRSVLEGYQTLRDQPGGPIRNTRFTAAGNLPSYITFHVSGQYDICDEFVTFVDNPGVCTVPFRINIGPLAYNRQLHDHYSQYSQRLNVVGNT